MSTDNIRPVTPNDVATLRKVIDSSELFPGEMLDDMIQPFFAGEDQSFWLTYEQNGTPIAITYCAPEQMTEGTWNLYLIAVQAKNQGQGIGSILMNFIEAKLAKEQQRVFLVETSGLAEFEQTRTFYQRLDYTEEARIREFYAEGEDKVVFWKKLN